MTLDNYEEEEQNEIFYLTTFQHKKRQLNIDTGEEKHEQLLRLILNIYVYACIEWKERKLL
jgi:hypothetical protein